MKYILIVMNSLDVKYLLWIIILTLQCKKPDGCSHPQATHLYAERETTKEFRSPSLPYTQGIECSWRISTNGTGEIISLTVEELDIEGATNRKGSSCLFGYVLVLDGGDTESIPIGQWCGSTKRTTMNTSGQNAYVYFRSDKLITGNGFKVHYASVEKDSVVKKDKHGSPHQISAIGMFGYVCLGWIALLILLKIMWDRFKKIRKALNREIADENIHRETVEQRIDLSIITLSPPSYDNLIDNPHEAPPPYLSERSRQSSAIDGRQHLVFDNFILAPAPPPTYDQIYGGSYTRPPEDN